MYTKKKKNKEEEEGQHFKLSSSDFFFFCSETMETMMEGRKGKQMAKCFGEMDEQDQEMIEEMAMGITTFR